MGQKHLLTEIINSNKARVKVIFLNCVTEQQSPGLAMPRLSAKLVYEQTYQFS